MTAARAVSSAAVRRRFGQLGRRGTLFDLGLAAAATTAALFNLWLLVGPMAEIQTKLGTPVGFSRPLAVLAVLAATVPLAVRRVYPIATLVVVTAAVSLLGVEQVAEYVSNALALLIAIYSAGAYGQPGRALVARTGSITVITLVVIWELADAHYAPAELDTAETAVLTWFNSGTVLAINTVAFAIAWMLGDTVRRSRQRHAELAARTAELAEANRTIAEQAVADERLRIARELHDVVAHHVSVMGLQAGAARRVLDQDRDAAVQALRTVEDTSRLAVDELQRLLGMLRGLDGGDDQPQPTMADLVGLVERMRQAGLDVRVRTVGTAPQLPAGVALAVYRVVQEALTNALKHAGGKATIDLELAYRGDELGLTVRSRSAPGGRPAAAVRRGAGRGLVGMRERVTMHGGQLDTRTLADGTFEVAATIPL